MKSDIFRHHYFLIGIHSTTETYLTRPIQSQLTVCVCFFVFLKKLVQYFHFQSRLPTYTASMLVIPFNLWENLEMTSVGGKHKLVAFVDLGKGWWGVCQVCLINNLYVLCNIWTTNIIFVPETYTYNQLSLRWTKFGLATTICLR